MLGIKDQPNHNRNVLLISHNFSPEPTGIGRYNGEMIDWLAKNGYNCTIITSYPYYPHWKVQAPYTNRWYKKEKKKQRGLCGHYRSPVPLIRAGSAYREKKDYSGFFFMAVYDMAHS